MAALNFFAQRLEIPIERLLSDREAAWTRLEADLRMAAGEWEQAVDAFSGLLEANPSEHVRAELLLGLAEGLSRLGRGHEAVRAASESKGLFEAQGRHPEGAWAIYWQAFGLYEMEQGDQAEALLTRLLDEIAAGLIVKPDLAIRALIALAMVATRDEEPERALGYLEQARARVADVDDRKHAVFLFSLALSYRELGDYEGAISTGTQSLARFRSADAEYEAACIQNELALVYLALGSLDVARSHAAGARATFSRRHDTRELSHVIETEGQIALASGSVADAMEMSTESLKLAEASGDKKAAISARLLQARGERATGDLQTAAATLEHAASLAEDYGRRGQLQVLLGEWGDVMAELGDLAKAYSLSRRALDAGRR